MNRLVRLACMQGDLGGPNPYNATGISGWLRLAVSQQSGGEWTPSIIDVINAGSPMVQTDADRRAAVGSSNGFPTMVFDGSDVHLWPISPAHNSTTKVGIWIWYKPVDVINTCYLYAAGDAGPVSAQRISLRQSTSRLGVRALITNDVGRDLLTPLLTLIVGAWHAVYMQYDSSRGGDPNVAVFVNGVSQSLSGANIGVGGTLTTLQAATGNAGVGGGSDSDTPTLPIVNGGEVGPNIFAFNDNLTADDIAALMIYERPFAFQPNIDLAGVVTAWLRVAGGTITGQGYASVPDLIANPAVMTVDDDRPPAATSANNLPLLNMDGVTDFMSWPAAANNNQTAVGGIALWVQPAGVAVTLKGIVTALPGATHRYGVFRNGTDLFVDVHHSQFIARRATIANVFVANTWIFITFEFDGSGANDAAKCVLTVNGVVRTLVFTDASGSPGAMPSALVSTAGPYLIGCYVAASHTGCWDGKFGPNIYTIGGKMTGATQGLLTTPARLALMAYEQPT